MHDPDTYLIVPCIFLKKKDKKQKKEKESHNEA